MYNTKTNRHTFFFFQSVIDLHVVYLLTNGCQNPMILDANADVNQVKETLERLHSKMEELQKRAFLYKSYQKNFKVTFSKVSLLEITSRLRSVIFYYILHVQIL